MDLGFGVSELNPETGSGKEWLLTNGLGGFAASTIIGLNTRRYHGLLVASLKPPVDRRLLVAKLDEELLIDGVAHALGTNQVHDGCYAQEGYRLLQRFERCPFPEYSYQIGDVFVVKTIIMVYEHNTTVVHYRIINESGRQATLRIHPLVNCRDFHDTILENAWPFDQKTDGRLVEIEAFPGAPHIYLAGEQAGYTRAPGWYRGMFYSAERERGLPCREDHFIPGHFTFRCQAGEDFTMVVSAEPVAPIPYEELKAEAMRRRNGLLQAVDCEDALAGQLALSADDFLVRREATGKRTIIAGYPWFNDWGRDAMIALPGLTLCTGRSGEAREILAAFAACARDGLLPNMFRDSGEEPLYNTVDASLWFFYAVQKLLAYTGDRAFVREQLYPAMKRMIDFYMKGTNFGIRMADDGLLEAGAEGLQLTWMDARVGDWVVTPRAGKPVEVNALWYNALAFMAELTAAIKDPDLYSEAASQARASFCASFWNEAGQCLYDVVDGENRDDRVRPNQIFAVSLPYSPLSQSQARAVVRKVWQELYTPYGLRSLSPMDPDYHAHCRGNQWERDAAYHQGTVWSWLIGPFVTACRKVSGYDRSSMEVAGRMLAPFRDHLRDHGIGSISEIFDGEQPYMPRGCFAQAWSVAEVLRCLVEDFHGNRRSF